MTRPVDTPADFPAETLRGSVLTNKHYVEPVYSGVVRSATIPQGKMTVVYGGGSGHCPAFTGWVGAGIADGAVCGNIFFLPSGAQAYSVLKTAGHGAGMLMGFGNYADDVLHFDQAIERLRSEGIPADTLVITDGIASGTKDELDKRRGIAGGFLVLKIAGTAAGTGRDFEEVKRIFTKANAATRSFGVFFFDYTLPSVDDPLFTVPTGKMGIDLGIRDGPGISEGDLGPVDGVAATLVEGLLEDRPESAGNRVIVIVNGLGDTKHEELFVIVGSVIGRLRAAGVEVADVESGEFVILLDMAGVSLTLMWIDGEPLPYWDTPCNTPAYKKGSVGEVGRDDAELNSTVATVVVTEKGSESSREATDVVVGLPEKVSEVLEKSKDELGKLDSIVGDGDHGIGAMNRSKAATQAVRAIADQDAGVATILSAADDVWSDRAGGTSGILWGSPLIAIGAMLGSEEAPSLDSITGAVIVGRSAVQRLGDIQVGDKTMVDALTPLVDAFVPTGSGLKAKGEAAAVAGQTGTESTTQLVTGLGKAQPPGEKSLGAPDPGTVSLMRVVKVAVEQIRFRPPSANPASRRGHAQTTGPAYAYARAGLAEASIQHRY